jgi:heptosyltransferase-2
MDRILVIRGGAIGDFILTLPALHSLRGAYPKARIEILGYPHIAALADNRFYADAIRSIEYSALSRFFARGAELPENLAEYFASFDLIISYLFDPDAIFRTNLERAGASDIITGPAKLKENAHASYQLADPIRTELALPFKSTSARVYPSNEDRDAVAPFLQDLSAPVVAIHPGSGSEKKNWPIANWIELGRRLLNSDRFDGSLIVITGEADQAQTTKLRSTWNESRIRFATGLPLPRLAALLEAGVFVGHDSGISHLAAAAGAKCVLLFGPTNPEVWGPTGDKVQIIRAVDRSMESISVDHVERAVISLL